MFAAYPVACSEFEIRGNQFLFLQQLNPLLRNSTIAWELMKRDMFVFLKHVVTPSNNAETANHV